MKIFLIAATALAMGGTAIAQDTMGSTKGSTSGSTTSTQPDPSMQSDPSMQTDPSSQGSTPQQQPMNNGNMSNDNMSNGSMPQGNMSNGMASQGASGSYPRCSRTVTDHCMQGGAASSRPRKRR